MTHRQLPITPDDIPKTAILFGLCKYTVMTFGLRNAGQSFQQYIFLALGDLNFVYAYVDDILITFSSHEEHAEHLKIVFQRLKDFCAIPHFTKPRMVLELGRFLGLTNFRRGSLQHAADIKAPLRCYLGKPRKNDKRKITWTQEADAAFNKIKQDLTKATLLSHLAIDAETLVVTDASDADMGTSVG